MTWLIGFLVWSWFFFYSGFVYYSAIASVSDIPKFIPQFFYQFTDKEMHGGLYFLLFFAAFGAFKNSRVIFLSRRPLLWSYFYCLFFGALTEWSQAYVPQRSPDLGDWIADAIGAGLAWTIPYLLQKTEAQ